MTIGDILDLIGTRSDITKELESLPLGDLDQDRSDRAITLLLQRCSSCNNKEAARSVISAFDMSRINLEPLPALTQLFLNSYISEEVLRFIGLCYPEKQFTYHFGHIINMVDDDESCIAAKRVTAILAAPTVDELKEVRNLTEDTEDGEYQNPNLRVYIEKLYPGKPSWVISGKEVPINPIPSILPSVKDGVELILSRILKNPDDSHIREALIYQYSITPLIGRADMLHIDLTPQQLLSLNDRAAFQEYGPVNTISCAEGEFHDIDFPCGRYGGCRMLLCQEFENLDEAGVPQDIMDDNEYQGDWYRGSCEECFMLIKHRHYCIREPLLNGGWKGCYCSIECMVARKTGKNDIFIATRIKEQLDSIGIRDR